MLTDYDADHNRSNTVTGLLNKQQNHNKWVHKTIHNEDAKSIESHLERRSASVHLRRQLQGDLFGVAIDHNDFEVAHLTNVKWLSLRGRSFRLTLPSSVQHGTQC